MSWNKFVALAALVSSTFALPVESLPDTDVLDFNSTLIERAEANHGFVCDPKKALGADKVSCYVEKSTKLVLGPRQILTTVNLCDGHPGCTSTATYTYTTTQTFTISIGINGDSAKSAEDVLKAGASAGASWAWSKSTATGTTQGYSLNNGDAGMIVFWPIMHQSCGLLAITPLVCGARGGGCMVPDYSKSNNRQVNDPNACGNTPTYISNGQGKNGQANGVVTFCYTAGPSKGQGCDPPAIPAQ